jgi:uncharacterized metal-binding protein
MAECNCGSGGTTLLYACSGAANTGYLADQVARGLAREGSGKITCLAALGAELSGFIESAKCAAQNVVIDGCPVGCGKQIFERMRLSYTHFITTDFGVEKGKTEITLAVIEKVKEDIKGRI